METVPWPSLRLTPGEICNPACSSAARSGAPGDTMIEAWSKASCWPVAAIAMPANDSTVETKRAMIFIGFLRRAIVPRRPAIDLIKDNHALFERAWATGRFLFPRKPVPLRGKHLPHYERPPDCHLKCGRVAFCK